jgi:protein-S-isoprenylcysteine O-methyltransferase Ste14
MDKNMEIRTKFAGPVVVRVIFQFAFSITIWAGLLFWSAGTVKWVRGWIHLGLWVVTLLVNFFILLKRNPTLLAIRTKMQRFELKFDILLMLLIMTPAVVAVPIVAGLDAVRYQLLPIPFWAVFPAVLLHITGDALMLWAMVVNPFMEKAIRIQTERGHHVITTGPYAIVRHPMYAGFILLFLGVPLMLGSGWVFVPVSIVLAALIIRTVFEDRILQIKLPGYEAYTKKTHYRLLPGIW